MLCPLSHPPSGCRCPARFCAGPTGTGLRLRGRSRPGPCGGGSERGVPASWDRCPGLYPARRAAGSPGGDGNPGGRRGGETSALQKGKAAPRARTSHKPVPQGVSAAGGACGRGKGPIRVESCAWGNGTEHRGGF